ncbi:MAG: hypothetical protein ACKVX7_01365 [Planctomycetota bacterium]
MLTKRAGTTPSSRPAKESTVSRVRNHLQLVTRWQEPVREERQLGQDLLALFARLKRVHSRSRGLRGVDASPHMKEVVKALKLVGSELLVIDPGRKRA